MDRSVIALMLGHESTLRKSTLKPTLRLRKALLRPAPFNIRPATDIGPRSASEIPQESVNDLACEEELLDARSPYR